MVKVEFNFTKKEYYALWLVLMSAVESFDFSGDEEDYLQEKVATKVMEILSERFRFE
jgi:hypothetical protein